MGSLPSYHLRSPLPLSLPRTLGPKRKSKDFVGRNVFHPECASTGARAIRAAKNASHVATIRTNNVKNRARRPSPRRGPQYVAEPSTPALSASDTAPEFPFPSSPESSSHCMDACPSVPQAHREEERSPGLNLVSPLREPQDPPLASPEEIGWAQLMDDSYTNDGNNHPYSGTVNGGKVSPERQSALQSLSPGFGSAFGVYDTSPSQVEPGLQSHRRFSPTDLSYAIPRGSSSSPTLVTPSDNDMPLPDLRPHLSRPYSRCDYFASDYSLNDAASDHTTPPAAAQEYFSPDTPSNALLIDLGASQWTPSGMSLTPSVTFSTVLPQFSDAHREHPSANYRLDTAFAQRYSIDDELGSGGFGFVVSATQTGFGNSPGVEVAVKFIIKNRLAAEDLLDGRPSEATILSMCQHLNIVSFLDLYEDDEYFYLVQELHGSPWVSVTDCPAQALSSTYNPLNDIPHPPVDGSGMLLGGPLEFLSPAEKVQLATGGRLWETHESAVVRRPGMGRRPSCDLFEAVEHRRFDTEEARYIFRQIVEAVAYMHHRGIRHRDLKDENITIDKQLRVKIIDFGSAVVEDKNAVIFHDRFRGTMAYAPAEILLGHTYQAAPADVWALGILLSIIVTGESPFPSIAWAMNGQVQLKRPAPRAVMEILSMCFVPDPRARPNVEAILRHPWVTGYRGSI